jgi:glutaconate CoA-transferase subunit B
LPGAGGAPEIATHAREVLIVMKQSPRSFVPRLDFRTSCGYLDGGGQRRASGAPGRGPRAVITDFGMLRPHPESDELQLTGLYPDVTVEDVKAATGWPLKVADTLEALRAPDPAALACLRDLHARTNAAHAHPVKITASFPRTRDRAIS